MAVGIYLHIPFCKSRCRYCDFFSTTLLARRHEYVDALLREIEQRRGEMHAGIRTIYFGGGTPSLLETADIRRILDALLSPLGDEHTDPVEVTLEANPGDLTTDKLRALRAIGINRLSVGIQSFDDNLLQRIGRRHTAAQAVRAVQEARDAGFTNISIDLIYGLPTQTMALWEQDIHIALSLRPEHISCYCLSYENDTALTRMLERGEITAIDDDTENRMYDRLCDLLRNHGYEHYEVSNFALPGFYSQHNSSYWNHTPYVGLGAGAHSFDGSTRSWNPDDLDIYINNILARSLQRESERLDAEALHTEQIMLGLRTAQGIPAALVADRPTVVQAYVNRHMLAIDHDTIRATQQGLHLLNRIIEDLV